jgi:dTDP-4-dehydrorhamnose 3,5-epimerase
MEIVKTGFTGLFIIRPSVYADSRGYFFESFNIERYREAGINFIPVQDNESRSLRGVIRGLHYQLKPYDQAKLIRVVTGKIFDVSVDLRRDSGTYGKWLVLNWILKARYSFLSREDLLTVFFCTGGYTVIQYKVDNVYNRLSERGIALNDPELDIDWKLGDTTPVISDKDRVNPVFSESRE